jgi:hypothetical protein
MYQTGREYTQTELPSDVFNQGNGANINGQTLVVNSNGTRSFSGGGSGSGSYDQLLASLPKASDAVTSINANENAAFGDYLNTIKSQPTSVDFYNDQSQKAGIPQLQKTQSTLQGQIYDLEDALRRVEPDVTATTGNSLVTEAQRRGIVNSKSQPLVENLGWLGQSLGRVSSAVSQAKSDVLTLTGLNSQDQAKVVDAYKTRLELATTQGNRALEAFTTDLNTTLDVSLAKIRRGEQLSDIEAANAFELLKLSKQAEYAMAAQKDQQNQPDNQIVEVGGRKLIIDSKTGKTVRDLGSTSSAAASSTDVSKYLAPATSYVPVAPLINNSFGISPSTYDYIMNGK